MKKNIEFTPKYISSLLTRFTELGEEINRFMHEYNTSNNESILDKFDHIKITIKTDINENLLGILGDIYYHTNNKPKE